MLLDAITLSELRGRMFTRTLATFEACGIDTERISTSSTLDRNTMIVGFTSDTDDTHGFSTLGMNDSSVRPLLNEISATLFSESTSSQKVPVDSLDVL